MSEYSKGYKDGQEAYINNPIEPTTYYIPGSEGYRGFADGFIDSSPECRLESWKHTNEKNLRYGG